MKVLHVPYTYPPSKGGGTEVYVSQLCRGLTAHGIRSVIAAPGEQSRSADVDGTPVHWFGVDPSAQSLEALYGAGDPQASDHFARVLYDERPDVVHQHALSPACSVELARRARQAGVPVVFTVHTPAVFCQQGAMMRWGREPCDVAWSHEACTACVMKTLGVPGVLDVSLRWMPTAVAEMAGRQGRQGGGWTAVRLPSLMHARLEALDELFRLLARIITPAPWVTDVMVRNGVSHGRIVEIGHGVDGPGAVVGRRRGPGNPVRLAHLGRLDPSKGTRLIVDAVRGRRDLAVTLDVFGIENETDVNRYAAAVRARAAGDDRIRLRSAVPHQDVVALLAGYDAVVVPSQGFETGPLVVLEAFAAGTPVIGSALGGIADKVRHGIDGLLVPAFDDRQAWEDVVATCVTEPDLLGRLAANVRTPRRASAVAADVAAVYQDVLATESVPQ